MAQMSVAQFATELNRPVATLLEQLRQAGVEKDKTDDLLTEQDKTRLLEHLRRAHGGAGVKQKITLTRKETSEIRAQDARGKSRTVQVEVRKKRTLVKRDPTELRAEMLSAKKTEAVPVVAPVPAVAPEPVAVQKDESPVVVPPVVAEMPAATPSAVALPATEPPVVAPSPVETTVPTERAPEPPAAKTTGPTARPREHTRRGATENRPGRSTRSRETPAKERAVKKVVTRASIIGEEQQRLRAEEERRNAELRARQEAEFIEKQQRAADLVRLKKEAEEKAVVARAAEAAKQAAAKTASGKPEEKSEKPEKTGRRSDGKTTAGTEKKSGDRKGARKGDSSGKRQGARTRGTPAGNEWRDGKHGKRHGRAAEPEHAFQVPTEAVVHDVQVPETISVSDL
ncbi:MAG: translation initiation factor IF-2 associated domain-containing protein, partial [Candidatus Accumulibacter sp.]|nr:translation initiation factor IF-2 associated domain-containing protein [Accumulibacter sp.]